MISFAVAGYLYLGAPTGVGLEMLILAGDRLKFQFNLNQEWIIYYISELLSFLGVSTQGFLVTLSLASLLPLVSGWFMYGIK